MTEPRFYVTELKGYLHPGSGPAPPGLSCHIIDRQINHQLVATYRTEDHRRPRRNREQRRCTVRTKAAQHCAELNAACEMPAQPAQSTMLSAGRGAR